MVTGLDPMAARQDKSGLHDLASFINKASSEPRQKEA